MTDISSTSRRRMRHMVIERQSAGRVPGIATGVGRSGDLVWADGVGAADIVRPDDAPNEDTQFQVASNTKTFTAVLVMALRDEGRLSLDDTVEMHIPESTHAGITIRQMLGHVTGMQREPVGDVWDVLEFPDRKGLVTGWNAAEKILKPHYKWHYSNLAFSMLGEIVARIDGRDWSESIQARILDPLGMRRTTIGLADNAAVGYFVPPFSDVPVVEPVVDMGATAPAAGLCSTVRDLTTWGSFLADPTDEVLSQDTLDEMCQPQIVADLDSWEMAWGLGLMIVRAKDRIWIGHDGGLPGHTSAMLVHRPTRTSGIALMNATSNPDGVALAIDLAAYVIDNEPAEPEIWRPGTDQPTEFAEIIGRWFSVGQAFTFSVRQGRLEARADRAPAAQPPSVFATVSVDLYRTESGRETGELLRVTRDDLGAVVVLHWATHRFTREPLAFGE